MAIVLYYGSGSPFAWRVQLALEHKGLAYERKVLSFAAGDTRKPEFIALNPRHRVPVIVDGDFVLFESLAITFYLAKKHSNGTLYPGTLEAEARAWQWSFWGMTEVERPLLAALLNRAVYPERERDAAAADAGEKQLSQPLGVLNGTLGRSPNLLGENFTVADLNVTSILAWARPANIDMSPFPKVAEWLKNCAERPAARAVRQMQRE